MTYKLILCFLTIYIVKAGVQDFFNPNHLFTDTILKFLYKYDLDSNLQFEEGEYASLLKDIFVSDLTDQNNTIDNFTQNNIGDCLELFIEYKDREVITYDDLLDDLHIYFQEFLAEDKHRCPEIRHFWEKYAPVYDNDDL